MQRLVLSTVFSALAISAMFVVYPAAQPRPLKVHISVDMEGIAGVVTFIL